MKEGKSKKQNEEKKCRKGKNNFFLKHFSFLTFQMLKICITKKGFFFFGVRKIEWKKIRKMKVIISQQFPNI